MMSEMVARVSAAIVQARVDWTERRLDGSLLEHCARAAIEAMRGPTVEMSIAMHRKIPREGSGGLSLPDTWREMIDEALRRS